jgi:hypothetical protein
MLRPALAAALLALSACASPPRVQPTDWRTVVTSDDRERLREWRSSFTQALGRARLSHSAEVTREGRLLDPDAAIPGRLPNGAYRCRVIKLGAKSEGLLDYIAYPAFACRVRQERELQGFAKLSGSQRPVGLVFPGDALRQIFLGTLVLGDESRMMQYGRDPDRDVAGWVEQIEPNRWRMILPRPHYESLTDVIELVPAS